ncbi:NAD(P)/FAD-dependent oxidoreductase [Parasegetibacter sp. NRK P23]|uniref:NAD(P)/FAD-dependent oxidoreductase n=1 Tax=Parasegetibacter sp. NRK P23 TaxID=2942999 RepID=UPI0020434B81|nr:NAD(P)/FAD-dependent oxidoreductase [Parasegetibacter sp. NRK P23]MCM5529248.1 NAD(P)/FAD-dependent oxidoreductase [Parasegetibacter sp. NRK P23]
MQHPDLIIIGGGAAGCFTAANAASMAPGIRILVLEKSHRLLSKVKVSGGGRCNLTHNLTSISEMVKRYPRGEKFLKKTFHQFFTKDTIAWFESRGVPIKAEADGRMFPVSDDSQSVIEALMREVNKYSVHFRLSCAVQSIVKQADLFELETSTGKVYAKHVVIACGGFAKAEQFNWISALGHSFSSPVPSLFTFNMPGNSIRDLMGISIPDAQVKIAGTKLVEKGAVLITHWGLSGPAVLKLSAWGARELEEKQYQFAVLINWVPDYNEHSLKEKFREWRFALAAQKIVNRNPLGLPQRFWEYLLLQSDIHPDTRWADLPAKAQNLLIKNCTAQEHAVKGKTTFKEEFVTAGGIDLAEIDPNTMMSRIVPDLYFAGEIMDVDGITGGFNFQHAWTSGFIAAKAVATSFNALKSSE